MIAYKSLVLSMYTALCAVALTASETAPKPRGYPASRIYVTQWNALLHTTGTATIKEGTPQAKVVALLGKPVDWLEVGTALYQNCKPDFVGAEDCSSLLVTYTDGKVSDMAFINAPALQLVVNSHRPLSQSIVSR